jgi:hypothetical protein
VVGLNFGSQDPPFPYLANFAHRPAKKLRDVAGQYWPAIFRAAYHGVCGLIYGIPTKYGLNHNPRVLTKMQFNKRLLPHLKLGVSGAGRFL